METRAAARQNKSSGNLAIEAGALQIVADHGEQFHGARLNDVRQHVRENGSRRPVTDAGDFDGTITLHEGRRSATMTPLDSFGFRDRGTQTDGEIVREVITANGDGAGVAHDSAAKNEKFRGASADVQQAAAEIALVLRQTRFRGSERLKNCIADEDAGFIGRGDKILRGGYGRSHQMNVHRQLLANHPDSVTDAVL